MKKLFVAAGALALAFSSAASAEDATSSHEALTLRHPLDAKFVAIPNAATCNTMASLRGNLATEASTFISKMTPGCIAPWHWHTPTEEIVMLQGTAQMQMDNDQSPLMILPVGSYSQLPKKHLHRFRCLQGEDCVILVIADGPFDIHWVDKARKEITFDEAMKLETAGGKTGW